MNQVTWNHLLSKPVALTQQTPGLLDVSTEKSETLSAILCCVEVRGPQRGTFMVPEPPAARHIRSFSLVETDGGGGWGEEERRAHTTPLPYSLVNECKVLGFTPRKKSLAGDVPPAKVVGKCHH